MLQEASPGGGDGGLMICFAHAVFGAGAEHDVDSLDSILGSRMLQAWKQRAKGLGNDNR
jgi:hypothetical protein